ncbi:MAG TPA: MBL fold metallo-hydrolase [Gemmatimonadales bacterium]|nr:MBL fold metallo-hydrolase [Gemmatimonadales bacterium]
MTQFPPATSAESLRQALEAGAPITVLDIRTAADRAEWWIPGSLHLDVYEALKRGDPAALAGAELPPDRPVVVVCHAGVVAREAALQLAHRGLDATSLAGGMRAWSQVWNHAVVAGLGPDTTVVQVRRTGKGCLSYLVGSRGEAAVIDPSADPAVYLELAQERGWSIRAILDTHIHADHVSRGRDLATRTGAPVLLPAKARVRYPFQVLEEGDRVAVGGAALTVMDTPGHTAESVSYRLDDMALFTGDTLFLGGVGRPDLEAAGGEAAERARLLHRSLARIVELPGDTIILPGHVDRPVPFDGRPVAATLSGVRSEVEAVTGSGVDGFVRWLLGRIPATPPNYHEIVRLNHLEATKVDLEALEAGANRCAVPARPF